MLGSEQAYKQTKVGTIPEGWDIFNVKDVGEIITGNTPSTNAKDNYGTEFSWATIPDLTEKYVVKTRTMLSKKGTANVRKIPEGSILVACIGSIGKIGIAANQMSTNQQINSIVCKRDFSNEFAYYQLLHNQDKIRNLANQVAVPIINKTSFGLFQITIPKTLWEQEKITSILSKVDELILKTDQIIRRTLRLKNGILQRLLSKGIGHTEFEEVTWNYCKKLEIPKKWKVVLLDEVAHRGTGHTPDAKRPEYYNGGIKWVSLADSNKLDDVYISDTAKEISEEGIENSSAVKHPKGTVIVSRDAGVGKSAILKTEMAVSQHFVTWTCGEHLNNLFFYYILQYWKPIFEAIATGTTIKTIGLPFFKKLCIPLPPLNEQQKIASILSIVDDCVKLNQEFKVKCERLKEGLMQKLLTGKIRVKV